MMQGRWRISAFAALAVLATSATGLEVVYGQTVVAPPSVAGAAPRIPPEVYAADPLSAEQLNIVRAVADLWVPAIKGENDASEDQIVQARVELLQPLAFPGVSNDFRTQYSQIVAERLAGALAPEQPLLNRLNAMIVASKLDPSGPVLQLILQGLQDQSPAVRYWAVMALSTRTNAALNGQQLDQVFRQLEQMLAQEDALWVLRQIYRVLVELPGNRGLNLVIAALNDRAGAHVGKPLLPYEAEWSGMEAALRRVLRLQAEGAAVEEPMRQLARAATQYLTLIANAGQTAPEQITGQLADSYLRMASLSHQALSQSQQLLGGSVTIPPVPNNQLNWTQIQAAAEAGRTLLTSPPFNFEEGDLTPQATPAP